MYTDRVAFSALGAETAPVDVKVAVVWGGDQEHEVGLCVRRCSVVLGDEHPPAILAPLSHLLGTLKLLLQVGPNLGIAYNMIIISCTKNQYISITKKKTVRSEYILVVFCVIWKFRRK